MQYGLGFFDDETSRLEPAENPFEAKVLPMSPAPCVRIVVASFEVEPLWNAVANIDTEFDAIER
jgi:hypothetical protein